MKSKTKKTIAYLVLVFAIAILLMTLWAVLGKVALPFWITYTGIVMLYVATFAGLLRGIIWTIEHFVKWIETEHKEDEA